jgi:hypothetical protein
MLGSTLLIRDSLIRFKWNYKSIHDEVPAPLLLKVISIPCLLVVSLPEGEAREREGQKGDSAPSSAVILPKGKKGKKGG